MSVAIEIAEKVSDELVEALARLTPQLSRSATPLNSAGLERMIGWSGVRLLLARVDGEIQGTLTLVVFPIPTGTRAWIEDVVTDESTRGRGVGGALTREAIRLARADGARTVDLTSRASREAANRMYERLGFQRRATNVYRYEGGA